MKFHGHGPDGLASGIFQLSHDGFRGRSLAQLVDSSTRSSELGPLGPAARGEITTVTKAVSVKELKVGILPWNHMESYTSY